MLSAETAIGDYPVEAVATMARIAAEADAQFGAFGRVEPPTIDPPEFAQVIAEATSTAVRRLHASAIVARTRSGFTARLVSKYRPPAPIVAATDDPAVARRLSLVWGVHAQVLPELGALPDLVAQIDDGRLAAALVSPGDVVVLTASAAGTPRADHTNVLQLHRVAQRKPTPSPSGASL
jgi:pyruvate kinase